jgi:outer membrane protein TolC
MTQLICRRAARVVWLALVLCSATMTSRAQPVDALSPEPAALVLTSFDQAKQLLIEHQPALQLQAAAVTRAEADIEKALSQLLPRVEIGAGTDYAFIRRPVGSDTTLVLDARTFVPSATGLLSITFSLSRLASLSSYELQRDARALNFSATRQQLLGGLAASMLGVLSAERVAARTRAGYAAAEERMRITSRLAEVGSVTALNALRFSQDLSDAKSELVSAVEALSQARRALGQALGLREAVGVTDNLDAQQLLSLCRPIAQLDDRLDRQAANKLVDSGEEAARAAKLAYLPELRLTSQYAARLTPALEAQLSGGRELVNDWSARASLAWTLYDGGSRSSDVTRAEADLLAQRADLERVNIDTELELRRSQRLVSVTGANLEAARASVEAAREIDRLSRRALELGTATALEVVDAARRLRAVEVTLALREVEELAARVRQRMTLAICE